MERYIGLDVHATSCTAGIVDARGKRVRSCVVETSAPALIELVKAQPCTVSLCMEEGTQSTWLYEVLSPHVAECVVLQVSESRGPKNDELDAFGLAERLRTGTARPRVFKAVHAVGRLRQLVKVHAMLVRDTTRTRSRIKALYRSRGIRSPGTEVYGKKGREAWVQKLPSNCRHAAELLYAEQDALVLVRDKAESTMVEEAHRHASVRQLETVPGLGPVRAARIVATVVTPDRFRTRAQFWSYCGLGIVMRSSSDWVKTQDGRWARAPVQQTRGLNRNRNAMLKDVFKGAATTVITLHATDPLRKHYDCMLEAGTKPNLAKLTVARKLAAIALAVWKKKEDYDPTKTSKIAP